MGWIMGFEEAGPTAGGVNKCPVDTFLGWGRIHGQVTASRRDVGSCPSFEKTDCHVATLLAMTHKTTVKYSSYGDSTLSRVTRPVSFAMIAAKEAVL